MPVGPGVSEGRPTTTSPGARRTTRASKRKSPDPNPDPASGEQHIRPTTSLCVGAPENNTPAKDARADAPTPTEAMLPTKHIPAPQTTVATPPPRRVGPTGMIDGVEFVRLLEQALDHLGFSDVARHLERRSGVIHRTPDAIDFERAVMDGRWTDAVAHLAALDAAANAATRGGSDGPADVAALDDELSPDAVRATFLILEQHYMELLDRGDPHAAIHLLRSRITPLFNLPGSHRYAERAARRERDGLPPLDESFLGGADRLHDLTACVMFGARSDGAEDIETTVRGETARMFQSRRDDGGWPGSDAEARASLLNRAIDAAGPRLLLPRARLETLVEQALTRQVERCAFHNARHGAVSLFRDDACGPDHLPTRLAQTLTSHKDEVWHVAFSPDGRRLASASTDGTAIVWDVVDGSELRFGRALRAATEPEPGTQSDDVEYLLENCKFSSVVFVAWAPDSETLVTCSGNEARAWNASTGDTRWIARHAHSVSSAVWTPDGSTLITAGSDGDMRSWNAEGESIDQWRTFTVSDVCVDAAGEHVVYAGRGSTITVRRLVDGHERRIRETEDIMSLFVAKETDAVLVNLANREVRIHHLDDAVAENVDSGEEEDGDARARIAHDAGKDSDRQTSIPATASYRLGYAAGRLGRYITRSCFGGVGEAFVASGGEDALVYVWRRGATNPPILLEGHAGMVNAVSWNPRNPYMLATAGDDTSVRLWLAPALSDANARADLGVDEDPNVVMMDADEENVEVIEEESARDDEAMETNASRARIGETEEEGNDEREREDEG